MRAQGSTRRRWIAAPLMSCVLFAVWLLLNNTLSAGHVVLAALFAIAVPWLTERLRPTRPRFARPRVIMRLAAVVLRDIVVANIDVARRILGPEHAITPGFVWIPLALRDPHAIVSLAGIISLTPGTLSVDVTTDRRYLLVHAFHLDDEAALVTTIKARYEAPLREIFES